MRMVLVFGPSSVLPFSSTHIQSVDEFHSFFPMEVIASDQDFALYLLDAADVAVVPGAAYGLTPHIRVDFSGATERLEEACDRIDRACHALT